MKKYSYFDIREKPEKLLFAVAENSIAAADEIFKEITSINPMQEHVVTRIGDIKNETVEN